MQTLFISDIHLDTSTPNITEQLTGFLNSLPEDTERLFILGDLFEAWIGDDAPGPIGELIIETLAKVSKRGINGYFAHGNRDFLVGQTFSEQTGFELLDDETVVDCYDQRVLIMHGDSLCTDDVEYQTLRTTVRDPAWQAQILSLDVPQRLALAQQMRDASKTQMQQKSDDIMDVNQNAVEQTMQHHQVSVLLHGHTHRPNVHQFEINGRNCTRIVLGDWYEDGSVVTWNSNGFELQSLPR